jgi:hypothetical protein
MDDPAIMVSWRSGGRARAHGASLKVGSVAATESKSGNRNALCSSPPPKMTMPLDPIKFDFGLCSTEILPLTSSTQHTLHPSQDTVIHFTTIVNDKECKVRFIFHPFRRQCNLTYHEYEIHCLILLGASETTVPRRPIIEVALRLYEIYFFKNAGYKLDLLESE